MDKTISCCGMTCSQCAHFPKICRGCAVESGKPLWCEAFNNGEVCRRYICCIEEHEYAHCGQCGQLPCELYNTYDPRLSAEENERKWQKQLETLRSL